MSNHGHRTKVAGRADIEIGDEVDVVTDEALSMTYIKLSNAPIEDTWGSAQA